MAKRTKRRIEDLYVWEFIKCDNNNEVATVEDKESGNTKVTFDDFLEYVVKVANKFWLEVIDGEQEPQFFENFRGKLAKGNIDNSQAEEFLEDDDIQDTLDAFGLDYRKFWYLCLAIKKYVENVTSLGKPRPSPMDELLEFITQVGQLEPKSKNYAIPLTNGKSALLTLKIEGVKHPLKVTNHATLLFIHDALTKCLSELIKDNERNQDDNADLNNVLYQLQLPFQSLNKNPYSETYLIALFTKYLYWFLKPLEPNRRVKASYDKYLLVSRMVYTLRLSDDARYLDEYKENGDKLNYLKNQIADYRDLLK